MKTKRSFLIVSAIFVIILILVFINPEYKTEEINYPGAYEALQFLTHSRAYPADDIPKDKYYQAYEYSKNVLESQSSFDDSRIWESMGPTNIGGRMISVAVNPFNSNTLYAGSASGGLWRTHNATGAADWHRIHTGFPVLGVMAIAISPVDSNTIYIGTGEVYGYQQSVGGTVIRTTRGSYGFGILKTMDGGLSWSLSLDWTNNIERGIQCIRINPQNPNSIYAATTEGIYKSTNAGNTWQLVLPVLMGEDIVIHATDTTKVMVSCGNLGSAGSGIYRSLDGGASWNQLSGIPSYTGKTLLGMFQANPDIVFASVANTLAQIGLFRTTNFGDNWTQVHYQDVCEYQGWFAHWVAVHPTNSNLVIHAGKYIYKSTNGGNSINQVYANHWDHHNFAFDPNNPNIIYIATDGGVERSTNFGSSYANLEFGLQTAQFYKGFANSATDSTLAIGGSQDNASFLYGGSKDWQIILMNDGGWNAINPMNDYYIYGENTANRIYKSTNRGISFNPATFGMYQSGAAFIAPFVLSPSNPSILYSGRRSVFKSNNSAANWSDVSGIMDNNPFLSMAISRTNPDIVYAGTAPITTNAHIFRTLDGGSTWTDVTGNLPDRYPMDLAVDPNDIHTVFTVFGGYGSGHVFKSTDSGSNWADITGNLPDVPTLDVEIDPLHSGYVYIGNELGVYVSSDSGNSWNTWMNGLPEAVFAMDLEVSIPNRKLRLATHGNGAYQRALLYRPDVYLYFYAERLLGEIYQNSELTFDVSGINHGSQVQVDSFKIKTRVLNDSGNEVFTSEKTVCCLLPKEARQLSFDVTYIPGISGGYTLEFIQLGTDQQPRNDTTRQNFYVNDIPTIGLLTYQKNYSLYTEITNLADSIQGDDSQMSFSLPFLFTYDRYDYDQIQISTNGWLEMGTGTVGSDPGLSTSAQIGPLGANQNDILASSDRPTKVMSVWWDDLNADNGGYIGYKIIGNSPNRVCVVQWKNIRAFYSTAITTRLNYQIKLHETSNVVEFCYGPISAGTFTGNGAGASIGLKDYEGGDYHYFDLYTEASGVVSDLRTDLNPLTHWPGPDSVFVIGTVTEIATEEKSIIPGGYSLKQNYPNPFNPITTIEYSLPTTEFVTLKIYNLLGQEVATLVSDKLTPGNYKYAWDASGFASGVYYYKIKTSQFIESKKLLLLK